MQLLNWRRQVLARKANRPEASPCSGKKRALRLETLEDRTVPALSLFNTFNLYGDYVAAGVGLRNTGTGAVNLGGIPGGSSIQAAYLYWSYLANANPGGTATFAGNGITGTLVGGTSTESGTHLVGLGANTRLPVSPMD